MHVCVVSTRVYRLIVTKFSANVERLLGFIITYSNYDGSIKRCCYGFDLWRVSEKIDTPRLHSIRFHSTSNGNIATSIVALTSTIFLRLTKIS